MNGDLLVHAQFVGGSNYLAAMGWVVLILIIGVAVYLTTKKHSPGQSSEVRAGEQVSQRSDIRLTPRTPRAGSAPNGARPRPSRTPTYTRERTATAFGGPMPWNSEGREIPFAEPGLRGPLFHYGGTSLRHGSEHDGPFAVSDFETTGLSPKRDRIVEVAVARVDANGSIEDEFATLVNPQGRDVGPTLIHGITNAHVKQAPTFAEVAPELLSRMSGAVVVAHNATFDRAPWGGGL